MDTLLVTLTLAVRPAIIPPPPAVPVVVVVASDPAPESLTTCYQGRAGSCWTEE